LYQLEYSMKITWISLMSRLCCGLSMAALTLALSFDGSRAVRAENAEATPQLQETIASIMTTVQRLEERLDSLETSVNAFSASATSVPQMLCVADSGGAQTCITKAQLDSLLSYAIHAEASIVVVKKTDALPAAEAVEILVTKDPESSAPTEAEVGSAPVDPDSEYTGTVKSASSGAAVVQYPTVEIYEEPAARPEEAVRPEE
jgi:hypothetical protein